jgi:CubicO group peptidase (beta-lactamase class C family)
MQNIHLHQMKDNIITMVFIPCLTLIINTTAVKAQQGAYSKEVEARIKRVEESLGEFIKTSNEPIRLLQRMEEYNVPAVSIAVIKDFKLEWARAYGNTENGTSRPTNTETLFQAASISKSINALGALNLVQQNVISLDKDINDYLADWKFPYDTVTGNKKITLTNLLSHTGGTTVHGFRGYAKEESIPTLVQILNGEKPANNRAIKSAFEAGLKTQYSGGGITIVQKLIIDVTGTPYDEYMKESVLKPLGMKSSFFNVIPKENILHKLASGHKEDGTLINGNYHFYPEQAAASLWTNPTELSKFIIHIQKAYNGNGKDLISKETAQLMLTPVMGENGLGTFIKEIGGNTYFNHGGANEGFRSFYIANLEKGDGVIVMINSNNNAIIPELVNSVATVYNWEDYYKPVIRPTVSVPVDVLERYVGVYEVTPGFSITIALNKYGLTAQATNQPAFKLFAEENNKFFLKVVDASLEFSKDHNGNVSKLVLKQNGQVIQALKK